MPVQYSEEEMQERYVLSALAQSLCYSAVYSVSSHDQLSCVHFSKTTVTEEKMVIKQRPQSL